MSDAPQDAKSIFLAAVDMADAAERAAYVERSCGGDAALRKRVDDLLRAYGQPDGPLDKLAAALASTEISEPIREQVGATIGPYKLMEQIGEGGFGLVFVAEQQQPIRRKVALKIIKPGMDTRDVIARFEAERQALALMDHPNIARVLDAGTTASGRPYFVMELVRGIPITDYCDQNQLTPRERLTLFVDVCNAVQHAHTKGIIHRDVKPSNVLVTLHDDRPVVKVIDFGVAKALHQPLTEKTIYTPFAQMIGTPLYMSPEQAQMSGLDVDARSDIYSLGVLLYELLTGTTPLDKQRLGKAAYEELLDIIREEEPPKPSVRLTQSTGTLPSIAALRKTEPSKLRKMIEGDVDWVTMKALEKNRTRRYETANAFAADILRYLNDEPVEASPPSPAYRLRKFARKHRKPVIALASVFAVLVLGIVGTTWGLFRAQLAERVADLSKRDAIAALDQVTQERDAREKARIAEAAQRDRAERQLAHGLLRPIGFSYDSTDPAELQSFIDWSAIKESSLKLRVLEIALENPETAFRVALRSERVIQACVGLSPTRRAQAIQLVSARQRELRDDPKIRIAACWLALELGAVDLPAWPEACRYLRDPVDPSDRSPRLAEEGVFVDRFGEFVRFAANRSDPQQEAELGMEPLIQVLEKPDRGLAPLTSDRAFAWAQTATSLSAGFVQMAPRLDRSQVSHAGDALTGILERSPDDSARYAALVGLSAMAPRLERAQVERIGDAMVAMLDKSVGTNLLNAANTGLPGLAPQFESAQAKRVWDAVVSALQRLAGPDLRFSVPPGSGLAAPAPRLDQSQVKRVGDEVVAVLETTKDAIVTSWANVLLALAPRLDQAQFDRAADQMIAILEKSKDSKLQSWAYLSAALAPRFRSAHAKRAWDVLIVTLEKSDNANVRAAASVGLIALAPRLDSLQVNRAWDALILILEKSTDYDCKVRASDVLSALAPRLQQAQAERAWDSLSAMRHNLRTFGQTSRTLFALAPRLAEAQIMHRADILIEILRQPTGLRALHWASGEIIALAPRLKESQAQRACDALMANLQKWQRDDDVESAFEALVALAPRLEPPQRDKLAMTATKFLLDYCSLNGPPYISDISAVGPASFIAQSISSPRALAALLSHPGCVGEQRDCLLRRFEELVLLDGKSLSWKPLIPDVTKPTSNQQPRRRFHNLHATAAWIQRNWPDFDLEMNYPVKRADLH